MHTYTRILGFVAARITSPTMHALLCLWYTSRAYSHLCNVGEMLPYYYIVEDNIVYIDLLFIATTSRAVSTFLSSGHKNFSSRWISAIFPASKSSLSFVSGDSCNWIYTQTQIGNFWEHPWNAKYIAETKNTSWVVWSIHFLLPKKPEQIKVQRTLHQKSTKKFNGFEKSCSFFRSLGKEFERLKFSFERPYEWNPKMCWK